MRLELLQFWRQTFSKITTKLHKRSSATHNITQIYKYTFNARLPTKLMNVINFKNLQIVFFCLPFDSCCHHSNISNSTDSLVVVVVVGFLNNNIYIKQTQIQFFKEIIFNYFGANLRGRIGGILTIAMLDRLNGFVAERRAERCAGRLERLVH